MSFVGMSYVLEQTKQQQVLALGQLGWTVSRIAAAAHVDRATVTRYLRAAGLPVRGRGRPSEGTANAAISPEVSTDSPPNPAIVSSEVSTDFRPARAPSASACEPYRELIAAALGVVATPWRSIKTSSTITASPRSMPASAASSGRSAGRHPPRRAS